MYLFFIYIYDKNVTTVTADNSLCCKTYTTNANSDWTMSAINTADVDSFSVQEVV